MGAGTHHWVLSGGIGSGKSEVRRILTRRGVDTIDADSIGHSVIQPDGPAFADVASRWPHVVEGGEIDRGALAAIVFNHSDELAALESMTHPHIFEQINERVEGAVAPVVVEIPLIDHGLRGGWRRMVVDCRDEARAERIGSRGMSDADVRARMAAQPPRSAWLAIADLAIPNHGSLEELERTVAMLFDSGVFTPHRA